MPRDQLKNEFEWVAMHMISGLGNVTCKNLLEHFGNPVEIFNAGRSKLMAVNGLREETVKNIVSRNYISDPEEVLKKVDKIGAHIITYFDTEYPRLLKEIHNPPIILYSKGKNIPKNITFLAMVGTRNPTHYGIKTAKKIGQGLARRGLGVVSGMARGIDSASHWGCLSGHGFTIAVLGTGLDIIYPNSNMELFEQITESGVVITEFPPGTPPEPRNFPIRNRIISGLSKGIIVVEANKKSGSLITASIALEQGREIFAVPGSIDSYKSRGCHFLIKQGACLIENSDDVLEELGLNYSRVPKSDTFKQSQQLNLDEIETKIFEIIGDYPIHIDHIVRETNLKPADVSSTLMKMELKGIAKQLPGKMFIR